jgi:hypothetical protein
MVVIPPMPRWLFMSCCTDLHHCTNSKAEGFKTKLLLDFLQLRDTLIQHLVKLGIKNFKAMDTCCITDCTTTANLQNRLEELKKVTAPDGIHFTEAGYKNLAERCTICHSALCNALAKAEKHGTFFWRGFRSTRGSARTAAPRAPPEDSRGRHVWCTSLARGRPYVRGFHLYRRN